MTEIYSFFIILFACYCVGSIPFGLLFTKWAGLGDIRKIGSGNIGATNALRTGNKKVAIATLLCDTLKGYLPILFLIKYSDLMESFMLAAALITILGHIFPIWLRFKGGKGVATTLGVYFALNPWLGLGTLIIWLLVAKIFRISSLSALVAFIVSPMVAYALLAVAPTTYLLQKGQFSMNTIYTILAISLLILMAHRDNIKRLCAGQEK